MTHPRLKEIRERLEAATPGPYVLDVINPVDQIELLANCKYADDGAIQDADEIMITNKIWPLDTHSIETYEMLANAPTDLADLLAVVEVLFDACEYTKKSCLCARSTYGFDYGEDHENMGMAKAGSRWLEPFERAGMALSRAKEILGEG